MTTSALAQAPLYDISGQAGDQFGGSVAWIGDVDLDGFDDFAVGAPFGAGLQPSAGYVVIMSGRTGAAIHTLEGRTTGDRFGWSIAGLGDINCDGVGDLIVGAPYHEWIGGTDRGAITTYSGATGQQIWKIGGTDDEDWVGWSVAGIGDVNSDGVGDYAFGLPGSNNGALADCGRVWVYSGANNMFVCLFIGEASGDYLGSALAPVGDLDGDGRTEFVAGAQGFDNGSTLFAGRAYLMTVAPSPLKTVLATGNSAGGRLGFALAGGFDGEGDGVPDIALGEPGFLGSGLPRGRVHVLSGATLSAVYYLYGTGNDQLGYSVGALEDANGDGMGDLIVGMPGGDVGANADYGLVRVFSGPAWQILYQWSGSHTGERMGHAVASAGRLNADSRTDMLCGANGSDVNGVDCGRARLVLGAAVVPTAYCTAKTNSSGCVPLITATGCASTSIADNFHLRALNVLEGPPGILIWSPNSQAIPFFGGTLCVKAPIRRTPVQVATSNPGYPCSGAYDFHFSQLYMAINGLSAGMNVFAQYWGRDPGFASPNNVGLTGGLAFTVLP